MDGVEPDDERYPDAPLPRHERAWRHPSEIGEATWRSSEPPIAVGRGLLITTGAIGSLLALAVLWAMLPTGAGGGANAVTTEAIRPTRQAVSSLSSSSSRGPAELSTSTDRRTATTAAPSPTERSTSTASLVASPQTDDSVTAVATDATTDPTDASPGTEANPGDTDDVTTSPGSGPGASTPSLEAVTQATISVSASAGASSSMAIAVVVGGTPVVLTTAGAVRAADDTVTLSFDDGQTAAARVAITINGLAVLVPDTAGTASAVRIAASPHDGDMVTLLGSKPTSVAVQVATDGALKLVSWGASEVAEGTPVVDGQGNVVALCSKGSNGPKLVTIDQRTLRDAVQSATSASTDATSPGKPYLGVQLNADPKGSLTINAVDPNGPAAAAGVVAGDTVVAIDDTALASSDDLYDVLADHRPDDAVRLTVEHADDTQDTVDLVLAVSPARA